MPSQFSVQANKYADQALSYLFKEYYGVPGWLCLIIIVGVLGLWMLFM